MLCCGLGASRPRLSRVSEVFVRGPRPRSTDGVIKVVIPQMGTLQKGLLRSPINKWRCLARNNGNTELEQKAHEVLNQIDPAEAA